MKAAGFGLALGLLALLVAPPVGAQSFDEERMAGGIKYACAGVGKDSRADPRWAAYPLKLMFAAARGDYLADLDVTIRDATGAEVIRLEGCLAPWLLVDLKPGRYDVTAVARDSYSRSATVAVQAGRQAMVVLRYPEITD